MKKSLFRQLLSIAKAVVQQVQNTINQQVAVVQDDVQKRIEQYVQEVVATSWTGRGADAFVNAIHDDVVPKLNQVVQSVTQTNRNITSAVQIMDEADLKVNSMVSGLRDKLDQI